MSEESKSLIPAARRELATATGTNPLVVRGLAILRDNRVVKRDTTTRDELKNALSYYLRGLDRYGKGDYGNAGKNLCEAVRLFDEVIQLDPNNACAFRHRGKARWIKSVADEADDVDSCEDRRAKARNEDAKAMKDFDAAIQLDPKN